MKIIIDKTKCIGCGSCASVCPKVFELTEDGKSHLKGALFAQEKEEIAVPEIEECVKDAKEICPVGAIEIQQ